MYGLIQKHKRLFVIIVAIASVSFIFWMFSAGDIRDMFFPKRCVATVNGSCITMREFRFELLNYIDLLEKEELREFIKRQVAYALVSRELLYQTAVKNGIVTSDKEVAEVIKNDKTFHENGRFSIEKYRDFIERTGITPEEYEEILRKRLTVQKLLKVIEHGTYVSDKEIEVQKRISGTKFYGKAYLITKENIKANIEITEEEMRKYYEETREAFREKPRKVYLLGEFKDRETAFKVYKEVRKKGGLERLKRFEEIPEDVPSEVKREYENLSEKDPFTVIKVKDTYYVLGIMEEEGRQRTFEEVKEEIRSILLDRKKEEMLEKVAEEVVKKLRENRNVDIKPLIFSDSTVDEMLRLFNVSQDEVIKLVFSDEKIFGPYRLSNSYVVLLIDERKFEDRDLGKDVINSMLSAKRDDLTDRFLEVLWNKADININEEFLK